MKSMQRKFGGLMKRSEDQQDVGAVLAEFKQVEEMLDTLIKDLTAWRNGWEDILRFQYDTSEAFANLYKPIEPASDPEQRQQPAITPQRYMSKCLGLQKLYSDLKTDLNQELNLIDQKLLRPVQEAKEVTKPLKKTVKHRENTKLDYEKYLSRAEHARKKDTRTMKEEAALAQHESNLAQAQIDYQTADDQVKQTFPPVTAAVIQLLPYILTSQIMLQTTLVGQVYTVLDKYTKTHRMPNPAPSDGEIIDVFDREFTGFRKELEQGIGVIAHGKVVNMSMALPAEKGNTVTGLGLRNKAGGLTTKAGGMMHRKGSGQSTASGAGFGGVGGRPTIGNRQSSGASGVSGAADSALTRYDGGGHGQAYAEEPEEIAPPKPPRPGSSMPSPSINMSSKPGRIPSATSPGANPPYPAGLTPGWPNQPPPAYEQASSGGTTPPSRYQTPVNGSSPQFHTPGAFPSDTKGNHTNSNNAQDSPSYSWNDPRRASQVSTASSLASQAAAAKKKPAPPIPAKRFPSSGQQVQYVTAVFDFEGQSVGDLAFREGDRIRVVKKTDSVDDWWDGELNGVKGSFPANYVKL